MAALYGFSLYKAPTGEANIESFVVGANSENFTVGDPVIMSGGFAAKLNVPTNAGTAVSTLPLLGIAAKTVTFNSTNQTGSKATLGIIPIDQNYTFLCNADGELSLSTHPGLFFSISMNNTTSGQFAGVLATSASSLYGITLPALCVGVDPFGEGTTGVGGGSRKGLFRFVRSQFNPGQQAPGI